MHELGHGLVGTFYRDSCLCFLRVYGWTGALSVCVRLDQRAAEQPDCYGIRTHNREFWVLMLNKAAGSVSKNGARKFQSNEMLELALLSVDTLRQACAPETEHLRARVADGSDCWRWRDTEAAGLSGDETAVYDISDDLFPLLKTLLLWASAVRMPTVSSERLHGLLALSREYQTQYHSVMETSTPVGANFQKMHRMVHFGTSLLLNGPAAGTSTDQEEHQHVIYKKLYLQTNRHTGTFTKQMMTRYMMNETAADASGEAGCQLSSVAPIRTHWPIVEMCSYGPFCEAPRREAHRYCITATLGSPCIRGAAHPGIGNSLVLSTLASRSTHPFKDLYPALWGPTGGARPRGGAANFFATKLARYLQGEPAGNTAAEDIPAFVNDKFHQHKCVVLSTKAPGVDATTLRAHHDFYGKEAFSYVLVRPTPTAVRLEEMWVGQLIFLGSFAHIPLEAVEEANIRGYRRPAKEMRCVAYVQWFEKEPRLCGEEGNADLPQQYRRNATPGGYQVIDIDRLLGEIAMLPDAATPDRPATPQEEQQGYPSRIPLFRLNSDLLHWWG
jgi:hypothetical protein